MVYNGINEILNNEIDRMKYYKTLYFPDRKKWREWLEKNFEREKEIWLVFPKKASGKSRISYNDAVEEALCFGWIDSTVKSFDEESYIQRFSHRNPKSTWSQPNIERMKWLSKQKMLHPSIESKVQQIIEKKFVFPEDILVSIRKNPKAWKNFQKFSPAYRRIRVAYIDGSRSNPEFFKKRLNYFIKKTEENKQYGYGGIDKYF